MSEIISSRVAEQATKQATEQGASKALSNVDAADQKAFEQALRGPTEVEATDTAFNAGKDPSTIGDAMLEGLEKMKTSIDGHGAKINDQLSQIDGDMSVQECMKLQVELMQMHLEQESIVKIGDKTSQGVQTMFKADK